MTTIQHSTIPEYTTHPYSALLDNDIEFYIDGNPLEDPPLEIAKEGIQAICKYFEDRDSKTSLPAIRHDPLNTAEVLDDDAINDLPQLHQLCSSSSHSEITEAMIHILVEWNGLFELKAI